MLDLVPIPRIGRLSIKADEMANYLRGIHDQVKKVIEDSNGTYNAPSDSHRRKVTFEVGDLVRAILIRDVIAFWSVSITNCERGRLGLVRFCKR